MKSKLRITGNDRVLMMLCRDVRRRWRFNGENLVKVTKNSKCARCGKQASKYEQDHIEPVGSRPRTFKDLVPYIERMLTLKIQLLCKPCHKEKSIEDRKRSKGERT